MPVDCQDDSEITRRLDAVYAGSDSRLDIDLLNAQADAIRED